MVFLQGWVPRGGQIVPPLSILLLPLLDVVCHGSAGSPGILVILAPTPWVGQLGSYASLEGFFPAVDPKSYPGSWVGLSIPMDTVKVYTCPGEFKVGNKSLTNDHLATAQVY